MSTDLAIVIPCYNCFEECTRKCLETIESSEDYNLIIVDNGSADGTFEKLKQIAADNNIPFEEIDGATVSLTPEEKEKSQKGAQ